MPVADRAGPVDGQTTGDCKLVVCDGAGGTEPVDDDDPLDDVAAMKPERIVVSPGPCTPTEAGISVPLIQRFLAGTTAP